jgi:hypothetical protein
MGRTTVSGVVCALGLSLCAIVARGQSARDAGRAAPDAGRVAVAVAAPVTPPVAVVPAVAPVAPVESPFNGVWRFVGGDAERRAFEASVTRTVQGLGFIIEGIAASRLRDSSAIPPTITIRVANNSIEYTGLRGRLVRSPADGSPVRTQNAQGEDVTLSTRITGALMVRHGQRPEGGRREEIRVNGNTLTIDGTVSSPRLPRPLTYHFTYRR